MTRLALGVAAGHKEDNVASNALWPTTPIESQATIDWGMENRSGSPEIHALPREASDPAPQKEHRGCRRTRR